MMMLNFMRAVATMALMSNVDPLECQSLYQKLSKASLTYVSTVTVVFEAVPIGLRLICRHNFGNKNYAGIIGNYAGIIRQIIIMLHYKPAINYKTLTCKLSSSYL